MNRNCEKKFTNSAKYDGVYDCSFFIIQNIGNKPTNLYCIIQNLFDFKNIF